MNPWLTVALLVVSNVFMTFAWYGHIKLEQMRVITDHTPLYLVILLSWCLALFEYSFQIPANRYGYVGNGDGTHTVQPVPSSVTASLKITPSRTAPASAVQKRFPTRTD